MLKLTLFLSLLLSMTTHASSYSACVAQGTVSKISQDKNKDKLRIEIKVDRAIKGQSCEIDRSGHPAVITFTKTEAKALKVGQFIYFLNSSTCNEEGCSESSSLLTKEQAQKYEL